ncbi:MAG: hypothetical protein HOY75_19090 [Streptomyces sp.]|nr:hypothetical protein [Streptomyces sp.]
MSAVEGDENRDALSEVELRVRLERGVPRLAAPAQRMRRVQQLVVRRRRRRVAGVVGAAGVAGGVAAAVTLGVLGHVPAGGSRDPGATYQVPAASPTGTGPDFRYPGLGGLTVRLPDGWSGRSVWGGEGVGTVGLAGSRPAAVDEEGCAAGIQRYCLASHELRRGEGLLVFRLESKKALGATDQRAPLVDTRPGDSCRLAGGTHELLGWRAAVDGVGGVDGGSGAASGSGSGVAAESYAEGGAAQPTSSAGASRSAESAESAEPSKSSTPSELSTPSGARGVIIASACLNRPSPRTLKQVRSILGSAVLGGHA